MNTEELARSVRELLERTNGVLDICRRTPPKPGERFNVFSVINAETDEVDTHCRLLYELLSPSGSHGMGGCFLEAFFNLVLDKPYPGSAAVSVHREYVIDHTGDNYGRIDLLIQGRNFCYPIEVKVYAGDQWEQVKRYARFSSDAQDSQVFYLTLDGSIPSEDSLGGTNLSDIVCLSFADDIRRWLKRCGELAWNVPNVAEIIRQYIKLLDKLTGNYEGDVFMEQIEQTVGMSWKNFESAMAIAECVPPLQCKMMQQVFQEIELHMSQMDDPLIEVESCYKTESQRYYNKGNAHPHIDYRLAECDGLTVTLRFQIDWNLYFALAFWDGKEAVPCPKELQRMADAFNNQSWKDRLKGKPQEKWFLWWKYLPYSEAVESETEKLLNFKKCTGLYSRLFDPEQHRALMGRIFDQIDAHIQNIRTTGLY